MNGFKLCKLIRGEMCMPDKWLTCWTPKGKQIMTHLENKGFAFHSSGVFLGEILGGIYRCSNVDFSCIICHSCLKDK